MTEFHFLVTVNRFPMIECNLSETENDFLVAECHFPATWNHLSMTENHFPVTECHFIVAWSHVSETENEFPVIACHFSPIKCPFLQTRCVPCRRHCRKHFLDWFDQSRIDGQWCQNRMGELE